MTKRYTWLGKDKRAIHDLKTVITMALEDDASLLNDAVETVVSERVASDIGTAGNAVRASVQAAAREPDAYQNVRDLPDGDVTTLDSGQDWHHVYVTADQKMRVVNGALTTATASGATAGYAEVELSGPVLRIGCTARFTAYTNEAHPAAMVVWRTEHIAGDPIPDSPLHMTFGPTGVSIDVWDEGIGKTNIEAVSFMTALEADGTTEHSFEATIDGDTVTVWVSNGYIITATDSRIATHAGPWATWETYASDVSTFSQAQFVEVWADTAAQRTRSTAPALADVTRAAKAVADTFIKPTAIEFPTSTTAANIVLSGTTQELSQDLRTVFRFPDSGRVLIEGWFYVGANASRVIIQAAYDDAFTSLAMNQTVVNGTFTGLVSVANVVENTPGTTGRFRWGARLIGGTATIYQSRTDGYLSVVKVTPL